MTKKFEVAPDADATAVPEANLIVRIDLGAHGRLGPGKIRLLESIGEKGSISAAARGMNMSYRQAWDLVDQLNHAFVEPVVASQAGGKAGGGAALTPFGRHLIALYTAIVDHSGSSAAAELEALRSKMRPAGEARDLAPAGRDDL